MICANNADLVTATGPRTQNYLALKRTLNHLAKLAYAKLAK